MKVVQIWYKRKAGSAKPLSLRFPKTTKSSIPVAGMKRSRDASLFFRKGVMYNNSDKCDLKRGLIMDKINEKNELDYTCGISDDELTQRFIESVRIDEEIRKIKGLPTSGYDTDLKKAYLLYPDGRKEYV